MALKLWRISNHADLEGLGGERSKGRWHSRGGRIVYLAENPALAMLEVLVHMDLDFTEVPDEFQLLEIDYGERKGISRLKESALSVDWPDNSDLTRDIGDEWLRSGSSLLLRVPSAIVPHSYNYLMNPRHSLAQLAVIVSTTKHPFDSRLL